MYVYQVSSPESDFESGSVREFIQNRVKSVTSLIVSTLEGSLLQHKSMASRFKGLKWRRRPDFRVWNGVGVPISVYIWFNNKLWCSWSDFRVRYDVGVQGLNPNMASASACRAWIHIWRQRQDLRVTWSNAIIFDVRVPI